MKKSNTKMYDITIYSTNKWSRTARRRSPHRCQHRRTWPGSGRGPALPPVGIKISWNKPAGLTGAVAYDVEWQVFGQSNWQSAGTVAATSDTTVNFTQSSQAGRFRVRADLSGTKSARAERGP